MRITLVKLVQVHTDTEFYRQSKPANTSCAPFRRTVDFSKDLVSFHFPSWTSTGSLKGMVIRRSVKIANGTAPPPSSNKHAVRCSMGAGYGQRILLKRMPHIAPVPHIDGGTSVHTVYLQKHTYLRGPCSLKSGSPSKTNARVYSKEKFTPCLFFSPGKGHLRNFTRYVPLLTDTHYPFTDTCWFSASVKTACDAVNRDDKRGDVGGITETSAS